MYQSYASHRVSAPRQIGGLKLTSFFIWHSVSTSRFFGKVTHVSVVRLAPSLGTPTNRRSQIDLLFFIWHSVSTSRLAREGPHVSVVRLAPSLSTPTNRRSQIGLLFLFGIRLARPDSSGRSLMSRSYASHRVSAPRQTGGNITLFAISRKFL